MQDLDARRQAARDRIRAMKIQPTPADFTESGAGDILHRRHLGASGMGQ